MNKGRLLPAKARPGLLMGRQERVVGLTAGPVNNGIVQESSFLMHNTLAFFRVPHSRTKFRFSIATYPASVCFCSLLAHQQRVRPVPQLYWQTRELRVGSESVTTPCNHFP